MPNKIFPHHCFSLSLLLLLLLLVRISAVAQSSAFTFQGRLTDGLNPANSSYDMQFKLFDTADVGTGTQHGLAITNTMVQVTNGVFTLQLDFGAEVFDGSARYLEIAIRPAGSPDPRTVLSPRQPITSTPYTIRSLTAAAADTASTAASATNATNALQLGGVAASNYVLTGDLRLSDARPPTPGSDNYIQNTTSLQAKASFNISGDGTAGGTLSANAVNSATQYNIGGSRVLSTPGSQNTFVGAGAGQANTGGLNSFFGDNAGAANTTGFRNSFFGRLAGASNTDGILNSFFGSFSGSSNTSGGSNSFFGEEAGRDNTTGGSNSYFGRVAGRNNVEGVNNSFFGHAAGANGVTGSFNSFFGAGAGVNTSSNFNSFFGNSAGQTNSTGDSNAFFGDAAGGSNTTASNNSFFGSNVGVLNTTGANNTFFGRSVGSSNTTGSGNTFIGSRAGLSNTKENDNTFIGANANGAAGIGHSTAIGADATVATSNTIVLGTASETVQVPGNLNVAGTVSKGGGSFKIDHPLDPANKTLSHSFVESPDMMNIYNGNVVLNSRGEAIITLPDYFEALNRDFRYQLTCIGGFASVYVAKEIKGNRFKIAGGKPGLKVSWQVTGVRQDSYANAHRIPVEEEKSPGERGSYLHTELFHKPAISRSSSTVKMKRNNK